MEDSAASDNGPFSGPPKVYFNISTVLLAGFGLSRGISTYYRKTGSGEDGGSF